MAENETPLLELEHLTKSFGGLRVVDDLNLHVNTGEIISLIGPNGAGKTTVFNLITGIYAPDDGQIRFDGRDIAGLVPHKVTKLGIARTFQTLRLFLNMTVRENVMAAAYGHTRSTVLEAVLRLPRARREEREIARLAEEKLAFFGPRLVGYRMEQRAYSLSYANRRRLEIARAITQLIGHLREEGGYTILVIEHDMHVVEGISDRVVALDHGVKIAEGAFDEVATHPLVVEAYLGARRPDAA
jgi:branched-chain amino acid transport system ATP-binding protein